MFFLNGLSKTVALLNQARLDSLPWRNECERIREALEYVADAYLSVRPSVAQEVAVPPSETRPFTRSACGRGRK